MSSATARCGARDTNSIVYVLRRFLDNRKTTKSGCSRSHAVGPLDTFHYRTSPCSYNLVTPSGGFTLQVSLCFESTSIQSHALLDSGASTCFINISFVRAHNIPTVRTTQPISVEAIDRWVLSLGAITEATILLVLQIGPHQEVLSFYLIATPRHLIVLGLSWLETHNPTRNWRNCSITFPQTLVRVTTPHNVTCVGLL